MNKLPLARTADIVVQELGKEVLIYDLNTHKAYNLNETSSIVYKACDGKTTLSELTRQTKFTDEIIFLALDELKKENLIEADDSYHSPFAGMTRRQAIRKAGLASMVAIPLLASLKAPAAVAALSCGAIGQSCSPANSLGDCCSGTAFCGITSVCQACLAPGANLACNLTAAQCASRGFNCCSGTTTSAPDPVGCGIGVHCFCA